MDPAEVLPAVIRDRASSDPDRVFLEHVDGSAWTFAQLHERALRWASALERLGVTAEQPVAAMMPNAFETIAIWLGCGWLRAWEVPLNTAYRGGMLARLTTHAGARVVIADERYVERFAEMAGELSEVEHLVVVGDAPAADVPWTVSDADALLASVDPVEREAPMPWDVSTILHTSGTTGMSKGVLNPWAQVHATAFGNIPRSEMGPGDVWYSPLPLFHIGGKMVVIAMAIAGGRMVIRERFSTSSFWDDVHRHGCTFVILIGTTAAFLASLPQRPEDADNPLRFMQMAPLPPDPEAWKRRFGVEVTSSYNMTEISCAIWTQGATPNGRTCGRVRDGYQARIVDEHDREVPPGVAGELLIRADEPWVLMKGYHRRPEATADAWRNLWFHTGDLAMRDADGWFYYLDRAKDSIRRRGENVSSIEVEAELLAYPGVAECAVVGVPSEHGEEEVKAVVVPADPATFDPAELIAFLEPRMADFMVPRYVETIDALPRTPTEKIRKAPLRETGVAVAWDRVAAADQAAVGGA